MVKWFRQLICLWAVLALVLAACGPQPTVVPGSGNTAIPARPVTPPGTLPSTPIPATPAASLPANAAQTWLAAQLGMPAAQVLVKEVKPMDWPDACLGLPKPDELCAMHITPGWHVTLMANNQTYEVRTDMTGAIVRAKLTQGALAGTQWTLVSFGLPGAETLVVAGSTVSLSFDNAGRVSGSAGCNGYGGQYEVKDNGLKVTGIISTLMACANPQVTQQESMYLNALQSSGKFTVSGNLLTIFTGGDRSALNFVKR